MPNLSSNKKKKNDSPIAKVNDRTQVADKIENPSTSKALYPEKRPSYEEQMQVIKKLENTVMTLTKELENLKKNVLSDRNTKHHSKLSPPRINTYNKFNPLSNLTDAVDSMEFEDDTEVKIVETPSEVNTSCKDKSAVTKQYTDHMIGDKKTNIKPQHLTAARDMSGKFATQARRQHDKPPPINLLNANVKEIVNLLKTNNLKTFTVKKVNTNKHLLYTDTINYFKQVIEILKSNQISFFTYTHKAEKNITVLLKNLEGDYDPSEIFTELSKFNNENLKFTSVKRFSTRKSTAENKTLPIYIVQLTPDSQINNLNKIKYLLHQIIKWEKIIKRDVLQCKRCQRYGHAAINCNLEYRCVKCAHKHNPGECPMTNAMTDNNETIKPYCINCNEYGHPASYRGCAKMQEIKLRIKTQRNETERKNEQRLQTLKNYVRPNITFSEAVKNMKKPSEVNKINTNQNTIIKSTEQHSSSYPNYHDLAQEIKRSILECIENKMDKLTSIIASNTEKINFLAAALDIDTLEIFD
ncbi:hypothetical protein KPH14_001274 [Odynerus spinipes]|uniref:Nucleic-acid-binding protein from transposon X-element n=1 Tax=Odynerus spinipes TaxID=1348599 RepID=A0AAD9VL73_9HYME|nr:hypothetical protein KPH14_001274 [Odynerus spinipes]